MRPALLVILLAGLAAGAAAMTPAESIVATMRLADVRNYAWASTVADDARTYDILGRTQADGHSIVKMPLVNRLRRRLGQDGGDDRAEVIFRGSTQAVIRTEAGWKSVDELPAVPEPPPAASGRGYPSAGVPGGGGGFGRRGGAGGGRGRGGKGGNDGDGSGPPGPLFSNLQFGLSLPHEELALLVSNHEAWVIDGNEIHGKLTETGARLLLVRDGHPEILPLRASGDFRIIVREGVVASYSVQLEGRLRVETRSGQREVDVHQKADTRIMDVGTTKFEVPAEARAKLGG